MGKVYSANDVMKAFKKLGFYIHHQRGSHITLKRDIPKKRIVIPKHKELAKGTFKNILRQADIKIEDFENLLK